MDDREIRTSIIDVCHRLYAKGFVSATDGNVSARTSGGTILTTRTAINKGDVRPDDIVEVDLSGNLISGSGAPSTEIGMHLFIYRKRSGVLAVVHAHPPYATGFAAARQPLTGCVFPEVILGLGTVPLAEYATPSTGEVAEAIAPYIDANDAILLANHGVVTAGTSAWDAFYKMEKVEHAAHITLVARLLGGEVPLSRDDVEKLRAISATSYGKPPSLAACVPSAGDKEDIARADELRDLIRAMIQSK